MGFGQLRRLRCNAIKSRSEIELKVAGVRLPNKINGRQTNVWIDSGLQISMFTFGELGELKRTLGTTGVNLNELIPAVRNDERVT